MKSCSVIAVSIVLAFLAANTSALISLIGKDTCDIKYRLHEDLASVLGNPVGIKTLNELRQHAKNICLDPKAHNAIVAMVDRITDVATDDNVSQSLGNIFLWARKIMKDVNFRTIWHDSMKGVNMLFDKHEVTRQVTDTLFNNLQKLLDNPNFDSTFEPVMINVGKMLKLRKNMFFRAAGALLSKPAPPKRMSSRRGRQ